MSRLTTGVLINTESAQFVKVLCTVSRLNNISPSFLHLQSQSWGYGSWGYGSGDMGAWRIWELGDGTGVLTLWFS